MSVNNILNTVVRPTVRFDPNIHEHRYYVHLFIRDRTWRDCPYVFALPQSEDNVYNMVLRLMAEWYAEQEFGNVAKMPQQQKVVKMPVDKRTA